MLRRRDRAQAADRRLLGLRQARLASGSRCWIAFIWPDQRHEAVVSAAARLVQCGYRLTLADGRVDRTGPAISEITGAIRERLERLGLTNSLLSLLGAARCCCVHDFGQYLFGRSYDVVASEPAIPFGFLLNLAVQVSDGPCMSKTPETDWREAVELARDVATIIDVQPYNKILDDQYRAEAD